jgi:hypothetical protein
MATISGPFLFPAYYQTVKREESKRVWYSLIKANNVFTHLPMTTEGSLYKAGQRVIDNVPVPHTVAVGQEPTTNFFQPSVKFQEGLALWRDNFNIDQVLTQVKSVIVDPVKFNTEAYMRGLAYALDNYFFNNSNWSGPVDDPNGFLGIKYRIADTSGPNGTSKYGVNPACNFQSGSSLLSTTLSTANAVRFWLDIDRMLSHMGVDDGQNVIMLCAPQVLWLIDALAKTATPAGGFEITQDVFDREVRTYKKMEIRSCGLLTPQNGGLQTAPVIDTAQDINGWSAGDIQYTQPANPTTGPFYTSLYFVKRGDGGLTAWQLSDPWAMYERITGTRQKIWMHDQTTGLFYEDTRCLGRIYGVQVNGPSLN